MLQPPLKWAGGKRWLVPHLAALWGPHKQRRLVEPFVGGLAVTLGLRPAHALLNDANEHVMHFYRWLKKGFRASTDAFENSEAAFLRNRARFNLLVAEGRSKTREASELFYYLNRTCFNGLCRFNRSGQFNVPYGRYKSIAYKSDFGDYQDALSGHVLSFGDFERLPLASNDFVYADPPYDNTFASYSRTGFVWDDQVRLAQWLSAHCGPVVASNQATPRILNLYRSLGFQVRTLPAPRRISCDGNRAPAMEMLATKLV